MATRNRTDDYLKLRAVHRPKVGGGIGDTGDKKSLLDDNDEEMGAMGRGGRPAVVEVEPPAWIRHMNDIRTMQKHIKMEMEQFVKLHTNYKKVDFGRDDDVLEGEINGKASHIQKLFKACEQAITDIDKIFRDDLGEDGGSDADLSILRNVRLCLINEINGLSKDFRDRQRAFLGTVQQHKGVSNIHARKDLDNEERKKRDELIQRGCTQEQIETIMLNEEMVDDRNKEFQNIYESIKSLHEMFSDLHGMVIEQGTVLDRIDYNMTITHERIAKGRQQLAKASKHQEAGRFKLLLIFLIVLILGFIIALLMKISG